MVTNVILDLLREATGLPLRELCILSTPAESPNCSLLARIPLSGAEESLIATYAKLVRFTSTFLQIVQK